MRGKDKIKDERKEKEERRRGDRDTREIGEQGGSRTEKKGGETI